MLGSFEKAFQQGRKFRTVQANPKPVGMAPSRISPKVMHVYVFRLGTAPVDSAKYLNSFPCILYEFGVRIIYFGLFIPYFLLFTDRSFSDIYSVFRLT